MRFRNLIALATVAIAGLAACGGGDGDNLTTTDQGDDGKSSVDADSGPGQSLRRIETAKETTSEVDSIEFGATFAIDIGGETASFTMEGLTNAATGEGRFDMTVDAPGLSGDPLAFVSDGEVVWVSADGDLWYEISADELDQGASTNTDPTAFLALLEEVGDVEEVGTEQIDGAETTHYHAETDVKQFADMQGLDVNDLEDLGIDSMPIDVWIDGDNLIRQIQVHLEMSADGLTASMDFDVDIAPSSEPVDIAGPPAGEIIDGSADDLGELIAGS